MVHVEYCFYHSSHKEELVHFRMSESLKRNIAAKLQEGVDHKKILDNIRDSVGKVHEIKRQHFVTLKDIQNIQSQYNISGIQRHANDRTSVRISLCSKVKKICFSHHLIL